MNAGGNITQGFLGGLVKRGATVFLVVLCITLFGAWTYKNLPREAAPDVEIPFVMVTTPYIGVSPEDIESLVTTPLENELAGVKDLKKMSSTSAEGVSLISLEFETGVVMEEALQRVRDASDKAQPKLPEDAEDTTIQEVSFSDVPVIIVTIAGPVDEEVLKKIGEDLQDKVERLPGVLDANLTGGRTREIQVEIDPVRLQHYQLSLDDVIGAIQNENVNIPGGDVGIGDSSVLLRVPGEFDDPAEIEKVAIKRMGDRPVFIGDVGRVVDTFADRSSYARMNGQSAVSLGVTKRTGANILDLAEAVKAVTEAESETWPEGVKYRALGDQSKMIRTMVSDLENGIITALLLVVGVVLLFMGARNSLFVALAIPLSFLLSMMVVSLFGMTLNMIVLFSLILALGMLVDNAIVLVENIYRHAELGKPAREAAIEGTREVAGAVAASTATTVAAFIPLVFWTGLMGEFMGYMPKTVIIVLVASLVVAVGVLPVLTARMLKVRRIRTQAEIEAEEAGERTGVMGLYQSVLRFSIRWRYVAAILMGVILIASFVAFAQLNHGVEFMPATEPERATIAVRAPDGTDIEATDAIVREVEGILAAEENVDVFVAETGVNGGSDPLAGSNSATNSARITVDFLPDNASAKPGDKPRVEKTSETVERIRQQIEKIPGAEITIAKEEMGPPVGAPISVEVSGEDFHEVGAYAAEVKREIASISGTAKLTDNYRVGRPELRLEIDRGAAKRVGASTRAVASTVRTAVAGTKASTLRDGEDEYDIMVRLGPEHRNDLQAVLAMRIPGREDTAVETFPVPLSEVARYELAGGSGSIRHIDQKLVVTVEGQVGEGFNVNEVQGEVKRLIGQPDPAPPGTETLTIIRSCIAEVTPPKGMAVRLGGANDEQAAAQAFLSQAFAIAIFLILIVLVSQFNRFDLPAIILASVILSLVGVLWGLIITGTAFSIIMTGLGVISLAGVVVNNAIVLLDYVEKLREEGKTVDQALVQAGTARFRPVMLTAITTILGLVPMALGVSIDFGAMRIVTGSTSSQWWGPMAVAVIFGLAFATILTLVMVPTFYSITMDLRGLLARVFGGERRRIRQEAKERTRAEGLAGLEDEGYELSGGESPAE